MGFDPSVLAQSAAGSAASGLLGQLFAGMNARRSFMYGNLAMDKQNKLERNNMREAYQLQRQMALDASSLRKRSLQNAGYSTADPEGTGTTVPNVSPPSTSASLGSVDQSPSFAPGMTISELANANLMNSQAELNKIESQWKAKKLAGEVGLLNAQIKEIQQTLPEKVSNIKAQTDKLVVDKKLTEEQAKQVIEATKKIIEEVSLIKIDQQYKPNLYKWQINELKNNCFKLAQEGKFEKVKAELAQVGIVVGADWMTQLAAIIHKGTAPELIEDIKNTISSVFDKTGEIGSSLGGEILDGLTSFSNKADSIEQVMYQNEREVFKGAKRKFVNEWREGNKNLKARWNSFKSWMNQPSWLDPKY